MDYIAQIKLGSKVKILAWKMMISLMQVVYLFKIFQQNPLTYLNPVIFHSQVANQNKLHMTT